jgi:hypothetical protein
VGVEVAVRHCIDDQDHTVAMIEGTARGRLHGEAGGDARYEDLGYVTIQVGARAIEGAIAES